MSQPIMTPVGTNVRTRREALKISRRELARQARLNEKTIQRIESGRRFPLPVTLDAIARVLRCSVNDLYVRREA